MRIRFLTATLEPGKDGIGDYTTRLADECRSRGHHAEIIAFNDRFAAEHSESETVLRLPRTMPWEARLERRRAWAKSRPEPDWSSLQFAPYALHPKGVIAGWRGRLQQLATGGKLHVMFHEIWIGAEEGARLWDRVVGTVQRRFIGSAFQRLRPAAAHTSNQLYATALAGIGVRATVLPLFGNVPFHEDESGETEKDLLRQLGGPPRSGVWLAGIFGVLHPVWPPEPLLSELIKLAEKNSRELCLVSLGRIGSGQAVWDRLRQEYGGRMRFLQLGEMEPTRLSHCLQALDFGVATTPFPILGKSGSVAALREHGLPVLVNRMGPGPEPEDAPEDLLTPSRWSKAGETRGPKKGNPDPIIRRFLADLSASAPAGGLQ